MNSGVWLNGTGMLKTATEELGDVEFKILVTPPSSRGAGSGRGTIYGDMDAIFAGFEAGKTWIVRHNDGYEMGIVIRAANADGSAEVLTTGNPGI